MIKTSRDMRIKMANGRCEFCNAKAVKVYHVNGDASDCRIENLRAVCQKHFSQKALIGKKKSSKYLQLYGMRLSDMVDKYGGDPATYIHLHNTGYLRDFLKKRAV